MSAAGTGREALPVSAVEGSSGRLLAVDGITKSFGGIVAVRDVSFDVAVGESVGLIGPNGAGKTTLFDCIGGQLRPDRGTVALGGHDLGHRPPYRRARMGLGRTYQRIEVFGDLTVRDHLVVAERAHRGDGRLWKDLLNRSAPRADELQHVGDALDLVGLADVAATPVAALGLGTCRLVELARALVGEPTLLMADEPSSGLDVRETHQLASVLRTLQAERGMAVLLVEHDLRMVGEVVDRAIVIDLGRVIAEGPFEQVMADGAVRRAYLGASA